MTTSTHLALVLHDTGGRPVLGACRLTLRDGPLGQVVAEAVGRAGEASRFHFEVEPREYWLDVEADGFAGYASWLDLARDEVEGVDLVVVLDPGDLEGGETDDEGSRVTDRIEAFARVRAYPAKEPPPQGRRIALEHKARMLDPEVLNAGVALRPIDSQLPIVSFGDIGRWVIVSELVRQRRWALLAIGYDERDLGWVDEASLSLFELDTDKRSLARVPDVTVDTAYRVVRAPIARPGIYGIIGVPGHPLVRATAELFHRFTPQLLVEQRRGVRFLRERLCQVALCADGGDARNVPMPPGRLDLDPCSYCGKLELMPGGLPEGELFDEPSAPPTAGGCNWTNLGPRNINGRIRSLAAHPTQGGVLYAGSANGGVWVTRDGGLSWTPLMRDEAALEIGAVAVHLSDPANPAGLVTIYAGTGEATWWPGYAGIGVLKSTNSGATWTATGGLPGPGNRGFSSLVIDPASVTTNPATTTVYATGPQGLYRTQDGGGTWILLLAGEINNVSLDPVTPGVLYAAVAYQGIRRFDPGTGTWSAFTTGIDPLA